MEYMIECLNIPALLKHYPWQLNAHGCHSLRSNITPVTEKLLGDVKTLLDRIEGPFIYSDGQRPLIVAYDENLERKITFQNYNPEHFWEQQRERYARARTIQLLGGLNAISNLLPIIRR